MSSPADARELVAIRVLAHDSLAVDRTGFETLACAIAARVCIPVVASFHGDARALAAAIALGHRRREGIVVIADSLGAPEPVQRAALAAAGSPLVWLDLRAALEKRPQWLDPRVISSVRGRGLEGLSWAVRSLVARAAVATATESYGPDLEHVGDLRLPAGFSPPYPVCVLLHGGGWRERWERDLMDGIAADLALRGYATWNLEYRRVGPSGGGWPTTTADVAAGIDHLATLAERAPLDLHRVALVGHSAGGHLALWASARGGGPRANAPRVKSELVVSIAGNPDLALSAIRGTDEGSTIAFMDGLPEVHPDAYLVASPAERLPLGCRQLVAWGSRDHPDLIDRNLRYCASAKRLGEELDVLVIADADHFSVIDPRDGAWQAIREHLERLLPGAPSQAADNAVSKSADDEGARVVAQRALSAAQLTAKARSYLAALDRLDLAAAMAHFAPTIRFEIVSDGSIFEGTPAVEALWQRTLAAHLGMHHEITNLVVDERRQRVVTEQRFSGRAMTGAATERRSIYVFEFDASALLGRVAVWIDGDTPGKSTCDE